MTTKIPKRIASTVLNSLKGGVVPRVGLPYVAVGREAEIDALLHDVDIIADGGATFRFIVGKYGSGKSFLLQTIRNYAMDRNFVVVDADLSPERRLQGSHGQGLATYKELIRNMSTKTRPEGGALTLILDRWISGVQQDVLAEGLEPGTEAFAQRVEMRIHEVVGTLSELVHGFDFAQLLVMYYRAYVNDDEDTKAKVVKWFRGEYANKTEARNELGIRIIISDDDWYEYIKLFASFLVQAGYAGLLVLIDELVNIYKVPNSITRQYNYEKILTMYNDTLQGKAQHLGIIMGGTPQCVEDKRRGVYSYEALRSRLAEGRFAGHHPSRATHARGARRARREAHRHPRTALRLRTTPHRRSTRPVHQDGVRARGGKHAHHAPRGHPRFHRTARHHVPESRRADGRAAGKRRIHQRHCARCFE